MKHQTTNVSTKSMPANIDSLDTAFSVFSLLHVLAGQGYIGEIRAIE
jgi:hypothetical protein